MSPLEKIIFHENVLLIINKLQILKFDLGLFTED